jgi:starch-binding outer membrane protein, SusD/RagB family
LMRPEEMLLIEAEAQARLGQDAAARSLLKQLLDNRYDQPVTITSGGDQLIEEILLERRIELWGEGFAALDMKRLKRGIDRNNSNHLPLVARELVVPANDPRWLLKIPQAEINANPWINEEHQNP